MGDATEPLITVRGEATAEVGPELAQLSVTVTARDRDRDRVLRDLDEELNNKGVHLSFVEMRDRLQVLVRAYGLNTTLDQEHFYPSLERALADVSSADGDIDP